MTEPENRGGSADSLSDAALDLLVFAPLGLALSARDALAGLAEKGRARVGPQLTLARTIGEIAVRQGSREAERLFRPFMEQAMSQACRTVGGRLPAWTRPAPGAQAGPVTVTAPAGGTSSTSQEPHAASEDLWTPEEGPDPVDSSHLAVPGYDTLSASQVIARLEGLTPEELRDVAAHERAGRGRRTILNRIDQLLAAASAAS
jgi:hypothetical protein